VKPLAIRWWLIQEFAAPDITLRWGELTGPPILMVLRAMSPAEQAKNALLLSGRQSILASLGSASGGLSSISTPIPLNRNLWFGFTPSPSSYSSRTET
jgi:hypothetical protein